MAILGLLNLFIMVSPEILKGMHVDFSKIIIRLAIIACQYKFHRIWAAAGLIKESMPKGAQPKVK